MHGTTRHRPALTAAADRGRHVVVWIGRGQAIIARRTAGEADGVVETVAVEPGPVGLAHVAHRIGPADHVLVLGPSDERTRLEREIVAIGHRPERIREEATTGPMTPDEVLARLDRLAPTR